MNADAVDRETARSLVEDTLNRNYAVADDRVVVVDDATIDKPYGWVFFYQSKRFLESGEIGHALVGNGPVVVLLDGSLHQLGTALEPEVLIEEFENRA